MDRDTVYRKTSLGLEAIAKRDPSLAQKDRSLLIMIDGRRGPGELAALGNAEEVIPALLARGFIEPVVAVRHTIDAGDVAVESRPPSELPDDAVLTFPAAQKLAVRRLNDLLGPAATDLCLRVEQARNAQEFQAVLRKIEGTLKQAVGSQAAARLLREVSRVRGA